MPQNLTSSFISQAKTYLFFFFFSFFEQAEEFYSRDTASILPCSCTKTHSFSF